MRRSVLVLLAIALSARALVSLIQVSFGIQSSAWFPTLSAWTDFYGIYQGQLVSLGHGLLPYRDFPYSYPPLFIYLLYPFFATGAAALASVPIVLADVLCSVLVYEIGRLFSSERNALIAGTSYALLPFALFYEGYLWLGSQPMTFFILLSVFFVYKNRLGYSAVAMALAVLTKQEAVFVLPAYVLLVAMRHGKLAWKPIATLFAIVLAVSMPFLIASPYNYLDQVSYGVLYYTPIHVNSTSNSLTTSLVPCTSLVTSSSVYTCYTIPNPFLTTFIDLEGWIGQNAAIPLFLLTLVALFTMKRRNEEAGLFLAASAIGFLLVFSYFVHELYPYYALPVYALVLPSCKSRLCSLVVIGVSALAMVSPIGFTQAFLATLVLLATVALEDNSVHKSTTEDQQKKVQTWSHSVVINQKRGLRSPKRDLNSSPA